MFNESVALTESLRWLQQLQFKKLEGDPESDLLDSLKEFINQPGFLPHHARLEKISSREVLFVDGNGYRVPVEDLSDGYRSILSMTFELIRQLAATYGPKRVFHPKEPTKVDVPGVVLIDEVDAHLHPTWQRKVGLWFREHFPKLQFIVTTHSPLVCQAAEVGHGVAAPRPGSDEEARQVTGVELRPAHLRQRARSLWHGAVWRGRGSLGARRSAGLQPPGRAEPEGATQGLECLRAQGAAGSARESAHCRDDGP